MNGRLLESRLDGGLAGHPVRHSPARWQAHVGRPPKCKGNRARSATASRHFVHGPAKPATAMRPPHSVSARAQSRPHIRFSGRAGPASGAGPDRTGPRRDTGIPPSRALEPLIRLGYGLNPALQAASAIPLTTDARQARAPQAQFDPSPGRPGAVPTRDSVLDRDRGVTQAVGRPQARLAPP